MTWEIKAIGTIHTPFKDKADCPIQGSLKQEVKGTIEVFSKYEEGLKDITNFSHITILYKFDRAGEVKLIRPTFLDDNSHGLFASRHPARINGIGISTVKLLSQANNILQVSGIDVLDQTPLLDIKPYVPKFDYFAGASNGWVENAPIRPKPAGRE